ncbi:MAG: hypothetical protein QF921_00940 [Pseudomonadales bacterium]|jgi:hypothetical protein|nr:hypothetical protein [Pseudomonadales bacterium]MDP6471340.1 hypothetical protein [Pseudomonadales bacterium]MDP6826469.1 hypothetical protein [Pseudomonadales bacterium]MDP6970076.1 hypothetical protein [Pseudomonadales bacterium]|tara:strand:+ start:2838 stop:3053 length:216 start_codon:yes stop_codon:yes gene_type:complete
MKYLVRFLLLMFGFALATAGLLLWHAEDFALTDLWRFGNGPHPLIMTVLGLAMIPPTLWEIFLLELRPEDD